MTVSLVTSCPHKSGEPGLRRRARRPCGLAGSPRRRPARCRGSNDPRLTVEGPNDGPRRPRAPCSGTGHRSRGRGGPTTATPCRRSCGSAPRASCTRAGRRRAGRPDAWAAPPAAGFNDTSTLSSTASSSPTPGGSTVEAVFETPSLRKRRISSSLPSSHETPSEPFYVYQRPAGP